MTPENFCYWLQGLIDLKNPDTINEKELFIIKERLQIALSQANMLLEKKERLQIALSPAIDKQLPVSPLKVTCGPKT